MRAALMDMAMLFAFPGQEREMSQFERLLRAADLAIVQTSKLRSMGISRGHVSVGRRLSPGSAKGRRYSSISSSESLRWMAFGRISSMK